jgi:hypothetical protein
MKIISKTKIYSWKSCWLFICKSSGLLQTRIILVLHILSILEQVHIVVDNMMISKLGA